MKLLEQEKGNGVFPSRLPLVAQVSFTFLSTELYVSFSIYLKLTSYV